MIITILVFVSYERRSKFISEMHRSMRLNMHTYAHAVHKKNYLSNITYNLFERKNAHVFVLYCIVLFCFVLYWVIMYCLRLCYFGFYDCLVWLQFNVWFFNLCTCVFFENKTYYRLFYINDQTISRRQEWVCPHSKRAYLAHTVRNQIPNICSANVLFAYF